MSLSPWSIDYFRQLEQGDPQRTALCARHNQDAFARWYCQQQAPAITSAADVLVGLSLSNGNDLNPNVGFVLLAASNSLVVRDVSALNPRGIVYANTPNQFVVTAMSRGDNVVEIAAFDPNVANLHFYALHVQHACDDTNTCTFADHFLPADESGWTHVTAYDEIDLRNTALDCLRCHEAAGHNWQNGTGTTRQLLMQEGGKPWPHWMRSDTDSNVLLDLFRDAHVPSASAAESYAGIPASRLVARDIENHGGDPQAFQDALAAAFGYAGDSNVASLQGSAAYAYAPSDGWQAWFNQALAGNTLSPPYWQVNPFESTDVGMALAMYSDPANASPWFDFSGLYTPDASAAAGITTPQGLSATTLVTFKCGTCHNGRFVGITRNNFDVHDFPQNLTADMRQHIRDRIAMPDTSAQRMPPAIDGDLSEADKASILGALAP